MSNSIQRQISFTDEFLAAESPQIVSHQAFTGLGISLSDGAAVLTVAVDGSRDGDFTEIATMNGTGKWRWPDTDGMNTLYNAAFVKLTWSTGTLKAFQKG